LKAKIEKIEKGLKSQFFGIGKSGVSQASRRISKKSDEDKKLK